jgi:GNAT superfamily N-acetyltransferase
MSLNELTLTFEEITEADIPELTLAMTRAFDDDAQKHLGLAHGGPDGYDNGEFFRRWLFGCPETLGCKVVAEGRTIGGYVVWVFEHGHNLLGTIFVDPAFQDRGVAKRTWESIEAQYSKTKSWTLETPVWATKNHYFYENKCGFRKVERRGDSVVYRKDFGGAQGAALPQA